MIIFNSTDHPILVRIGGKEFAVAANRYVEEDVESGVYPLFVCKQSASGKPMTFRRENSEDWGRFARNGIVSLAAEGEVEIQRDTKLHIEAHRQKSRLYGYGKQTTYLELLDCTADNGTLCQLRSVFVTSSQRRRLVNSLVLMLGVIVFFHAMITLVPLAAWNDPEAWLYVAIFQILFVFEEWQSIRALRTLKKYSVAENKNN